MRLAEELHFRQREADQLARLRVQLRRLQFEYAARAIERLLSVVGDDAFCAWRDATIREYAAWAASLA